MLKIIAHRGFWLEKSEQNTLKAFEKAFENGFGVETDVRDFKGELVISHDLATKNALPLRELLKLHADFCKKLALNSTPSLATPPNISLPLALNIKADGLQSPLKALLKEFKTQNYFVFDMSMPDMLGFERENIAFYTRQSEFEPSPHRHMKPLYEKAAGVWLDGFFENFLKKKYLLNHLKKGKALCIVSPELHHYAYMKEWKRLRQILIKMQNLKSFNKALNKFSICTDHPQKAREFFNENGH